VVSEEVSTPLRILGLPALTDERWELVHPLLPLQPPQTSRPAVDHRLIVEGILWIMRTSSSWRSLPPRFGAWSKVLYYYRQWCENGRWARILQLLQIQEVPISSSA
jgi:transposase